MKGVVFLCIVACVSAVDQSLIEEKKANIMEFGLECAETEHATPEDIEALKQYKPAITHEGRCVIFCINKKLTLMNEDGTIVEKPSTDWLSRVKINDPELYGNMVKVQTACYTKVQFKGDGCDTAQNFFICINEESKKYGIDKLFA